MESVMDPVIYKEIMEDTIIVPGINYQECIFQGSGVEETLLDKIKLQNDFYNVYIDNEIFYQNNFMVIKSKLKMAAEMMQSMHSHIKRLEQYNKMLEDKNTNLQLYNKTLEDYVKTKLN